MWYDVISLLFINAYFQNETRFVGSRSLSLNCTGFGKQAFLSPSLKLVAVLDFGAKATIEAFYFIKCANIYFLQNLLHANSQLN